MPAEQPPHEADGVLALVVAGDGDINPVEGRVGITKSDDGDVHVGGFGEALVVKSGVEDNDKSGFLEPI